MNKIDIDQLVPPHVAAMTGYSPVPPVSFAPGVLKMDLNESMVPPSPRVAEAVRAVLDAPAALQWYPEPTCAELRADIGRYMDVPADHVLVTNGSNQAMELFARAFLGVGEPSLIVSPVYSVFKIQCQLQQTRIEEFYFTDPFAPDFSELLEQRSLFKVLFLANPNNPTGAGFDREQIVALLERYAGSLIVLDEAYGEFHQVRCADLVRQYGNLVVLRSFSKAFALAGLRCGYVVAQPSVLRALMQVFPPWSVNALTQAAARAALADVSHMRQTVVECGAAKQLIVENLRQLGHEAFNTRANFILWRVAEPAQVTARLAERRAYVSNKDAVRQMKGCLRVTVGDRQQAAEFLQIVREALP